MGLIFSQIILLISGNSESLAITKIVSFNWKLYLQHAHAAYTKGFQHLVKNKNITERGHSTLLPQTN